METSGSTGRPKRVLLSRRALRRLRDRHPRAARRPRAAGCSRSRRRTSRGCRWSSARCSPATSPRCSDDRPFAEAAHGTAAYVSLVPTQLHRLLDDAARPRGAAPASTRCCSAAARSTPACAPAPRRPGVRVVATYGSSETCGGCVYDGVPARRGRGRRRRQDGADPDPRPGAVRRLRRRPGADRRDPGRRLVRHLRPRPARRRRPAARPRPRRRRRRQRRRQRAHPGGRRAGCASTPTSPPSRWSASRRPGVGPARGRRRGRPARPRRRPATGSPSSTPASWAPRDLVVARRAADARQRQGRPAAAPHAGRRAEDA